MHHDRPRPVPIGARRIVAVPYAIAASGIALWLFLADVGPFPVVLAAAVALYLAWKAAAVLRRTADPVPEALEPEPLPEPAVDPATLRDAFAATGAFPSGFDWPAVDRLFALNAGTDAVDYLSAVSEHEAGARVAPDGRITFGDPIILDRFATIVLDLEAHEGTYRDLLGTLRRLAHPVPVGEPEFRALDGGTARLSFTCGDAAFDAPVAVTGKWLDHAVPEHVVRTVCAASDEPLVLVPVDATVHALRLAPGRLGPFARATGLDIVGPRAVAGRVLG